MIRKNAMGTVKVSKKINNLIKSIGYPYIFCYEMEVASKKVAKKKSGKPIKHMIGTSPNNDTHH